MTAFHELLDVSRGLVSSVAVPCLEVGVTLIVIEVGDSGLMDGKGKTLLMDSGSCSEVQR